MVQLLMLQAGYYGPSNGFFYGMSSGTTGAWFLIILIGIVGWIVQARLQSVFAKYSNVSFPGGLSGAEVAEKMLRDNGIHNVKITHVQGHLTDHFNPQTMTVNLSDSVYRSRSVAAAAVAAHECGHAIQHAQGYAPLELRSQLVPIVNFSSRAATFVLIFPNYSEQPVFGQKGKTATISGDAAGEVRPLVSGEQLLIEADGEQPPGGGITPMQCALMLLAVTLGITAYGIWRRRTFWWFDLLLFAAAGLGGCVLAFLAMFSQHPAVDQNYLLFVFHPLHLLCLPCMLRKVAKRRFSWYMAANFTALTLFMTFWGILPQRFPLAVLPLALCLLTRSVGAYILYKTNKNGQPA